ISLFMVLITVSAMLFAVSCGRAPGEMPAANQNDDGYAYPTFMPFPEINGAQKNGRETDVSPGDENKVASRLTGMPIDADDSNRRPLAFVINNMFRALPQSGVAHADIIYEVLAEGDITRLIAIVQCYAQIEKIGPIRSARDYFVQFALDYDAVFIHHGGSPSGYRLLNTLRADRVDAMTCGAFWRCPVRSVQPGMMEHSSYTDAANLIKEMERTKIRSELNGGGRFGFSFGSGYMRPDPDAARADRITVPFSRNYTRTFLYNADGLYEVHNRDGAHIDMETGETLTVSNVLIQSVRMRVIPGDSEGRREVGAVGEGGGYLATAGGYIRIKWSKADDFSPTVWTKEDGTELVLTAGKTWICVLSENEKAVFGNE
ncbi:MAG: DUF3048 domain-containing protein, partial [Defluviitaleaceae bacterium]|nr:DUF3048 domain-containing protein [Defluviitaleaceae bacterium]